MTEFDQPEEDLDIHDRPTLPDLRVHPHPRIRKIPFDLAAAKFFGATSPAAAALVEGEEEDAWWASQRRLWLARWVVITSAVCGVILALAYLR